MAKNQATAATATAGTAPSTKTPVAAPAAPQADAGVDISKLTPAQLAALQKQLKEKGKGFRENKDKRFELIDGMLQEKDADGSFKNSTRDILNKLVEGKLVDTTVPDYDKVEIKKIQARKQFLEKKTDEAGKLVHPAGTLGYKPSEFSGFTISNTKVAQWFNEPKHVATLTADERKSILAALK